jgi:hypothetical protein
MRSAYQKIGEAQKSRGESLVFRGEMPKLKPLPLLEISRWFACFRVTFGADDRLSIYEEIGAEDGRWN